MPLSSPGNGERFGVWKDLTGLKAAEGMAKFWPAVLQLVLSALTPPMRLDAVERRPWILLLARVLSSELDMFVCESQGQGNSEDLATEDVFK